MAALLALLLFQPVADAQRVGVVLDPHRAPVAGAAVSVVCRDATHDLRSGEAGEFTVPRSAGAGCVLRVRHPGFLPVDRPLAASPGRLVIALALAPLAEDVTVESAPVPAAAEGLDAAWLDERLLRRFGNDPARMLAEAALRGGARDLDGAVIVDGVAGRSLPAGVAIAAIAVNRDVFSAANAEPDRPHVEITTRAPARRVSARFGGASLGAGGRNPIATRPDPRSDRLGLQLTAPLPGLPLLMALDLSGQRDRRARAAGLAVGDDAPAAIDTRSGRISAALHYHRRASRVALSVIDERRGSEGFAGDELASRESGLRSASRRREAAVLAESGGRRMRHHASFLYTDRRFSDRAMADAPGVAVRGVSYTGGAPISRTAMDASAWQLRVVSRPAASEAWLAGASVGRAHSRLASTPNPFGVLHLPSGLLHRGRGDTRLARTTWDAALFADRAWMLPRGSIKAGLRLDRQSPYPPALSPRLAASLEVAGFVVRGGAAIFTRPVPGETLLAAGAGEGRDGERFIGAEPVRRAVASHLARPAGTLARASVERRIGGLAAGLEFWTTRGRREMGERRVRDGAGWLDLLESTRRSREDRWRLRIIAGTPRHQLTAHYIFTNAFDDGAGTAPEWARAAGVPRHAVRAAMDLSLPLGLAVSLTAVFQSGAPYDITLLEDENGDGLYADRGPAGRMSGLTPPMRTVSVNAYRSIALPAGFLRLRALDVGLDARNVFDDLRVLSVGAVVGTPSAGRVLAAAPGRSVRIWAAFR